jgi:hypothetical protein
MKRISKRKHKDGRDTPDVAQGWALARPAAPSTFVTAVVDDWHDVEWLVGALAGAGFGSDVVHVLSGEAGTEALERDGSGRPIIAQLLIRLEELGLAYDVGDRHQEELVAGHSVIAIVADADDVELLHELLAAHGAHFAHQLDQLSAEELIR